LKGHNYNNPQRFVNLFSTGAKLQEKMRIGSKVKRIHDDPQPPCARVLARPDVSETDKASLRETCASLDVVQ
jgi:hypothetical protein